MRNLEEKEIKQFSEFTEVTPESSQNLITDKGRFTVGALYNAVIAYATGLINAAVNSAVSSVQELCNSAASEAVEGVEETIAAAAEGAAAEAAALAEAAKTAAETAKTGRKPRRRRPRPRKGRLRQRRAKPPRARPLAVAQADNYSNPSLVGGAKVPIRLSRAKIFNFLVDTDGAPYTLEDYISGKEESPVLRQCAPGLHFENDSSKFPTVSTWGNGAAAYDGSDIVVSGFATSNWSLLACTFPEPIAAGSRVRVKLRFESGSSASYNCFLYETSSNRLSMGTATDGTDFEWEGVCPYNAAHLYIQATAASWSSAEYKLVSSSVEVLGPVLSLADSADGAVVKDLSGAANHAVIGGTVAARQNILALAPQKISWAGTATAQNVCGEKGAPADSLVTIYARASSAVSLSVKCATNAAASKDLTAGVWTLCGSWTVPTAGAIVATPSAAFTGSIEFNVKIERFK